MSSEPIASAPQASEAPPGEFIADAELVLAALNRMETAVQADRTALARLRPALAELAVALGNAKRAVTLGSGRPLDVAMLLDALEHQVDAMIEIAGAEPVSHPSVATPAAPIEGAEPRVPTTSDVVSGLGDEPRGNIASANAEVSSSVFETDAMVQALSAPSPAEPMLSAKTQAQPPVEAVAPSEPSPPALNTVETESAWLVSVAEQQAASADPAPSAAATRREPDIDDLAELLFEPTPDSSVATEPQAESQPPSPAPVTPAATPATESSEGVSEKRRGVAHDPLAPLHAMSPEERLALFS